MNLLLRGDARSIPLADESVHCVVTSPPYWGLRDYGTARWEGGDDGCDHLGPRKRTAAGFAALSERLDGIPRDPDAPCREGVRIPYRDACGKCGARRVDRQLGLESTPEAYVAAMVAVFREVWRVLRDDGTLWLNIGDSYAQGGHGGNLADSRWAGFVGNGEREATAKAGARKAPPGLKPKDLIGIPWRLALALQADGWYLRDPIVWAKAKVSDDDELEGSAMPGSQRDRCTSAYELLFMLAKRERYFYDPEACKAKSGAMLRNVWRINPEPTKIKHFATFPRELARRCVLLGTSQRGCCPKCGAPWVRETSVEQIRLTGSTGSAHVPGHNNWAGVTARTRKQVSTLGWQPSCKCTYWPDPIEQRGSEEVWPPRRPYDPVPCTVLDPFAGSGTTLVVAEALGRNAIGLDLSREYLTLAQRRIERPHAVVPRPGRAEYLPLFRDEVACQAENSPEGD